MKLDFLLKNRMKILIANDSRLEIQILTDEVKSYFRGKQEIIIFSCSRGDDALELIEKECPDLVFLDWVMPGIEGPSICEAVRSCPYNEYRTYCYIIMTTSRGDKKSVIKGLSAGADDFVTKPFCAEDIEVRTIVAMRVIDAYKKLLYQKEAIERISRVDMLTGILNRRFVIQYLKDSLLDSEKDVFPLSVCLCDVDLFKHINDRHGHLAGDFVLRTLGKFFSSFFGKNGMVGRYGGDEFLFVIPGLDLLSSRELFERFYEELSVQKFIFEGVAIDVNLSCGLVTSGAFIKSKNSSSDYLIRKADEALYRSKEGGRGQVCLGEMKQSFDVVYDF